jgi:phage baseplate assembly protein W
MATAKFLGKGVRFGFRDGLTGVGTDGGRVAEVSGEELIRQSIWLILSTAPGERVGRPDFGCGIQNLVFGTQSASTMGEVIHEVESALGKWEPRIDIASVDAKVDPDEPTVLLIEIDYVVRATNSRFNLVYPFYLSS